MQVPITLPVLPLRDIVISPNTVVPLFVGREKSVNALEDVAQEDGQIFLVAQKDSDMDDPGTQDIYKVGVVANMLQLLRLPDGTVKLLAEAGQRADVLEYREEEKYIEADITIPERYCADDQEREAMSRSLLAAFAGYAKLNRKISPELVDRVRKTEDGHMMVDSISAHIPISIAQKQEILEEIEAVKRMELLLAALTHEIDILGTEKKIRTRVRSQIEKNQKEYYLNEQMKAIQKELGDEEKGGEKDEAHIYKERIESTKLSKEAKEKAKAELKKLSHMSPMSAEATVVRNYLDWLLDIPWKKNTRIKRDIDLAQKTLDRDHYGLEKVKERIIEYLAVQQRKKTLKGPIICLVGPPGVGKTSLAKSVAEATGRNFVRISLGGVRDESEIRGHRRTYIGSMPGRIIQSMKKAKSSNPLFLLDEIDKMGNDFRGDPAAALLEVLDPEQNHNFSDHYLEVEYDLSDVMFVTTANSMDMPRPLLDRMEVIHLSGYTEDEKLGIARHHLIDEQRKEHGLEDGEWEVSDDTVRHVIRHYTRESGVRGLERELAKLARKTVTKIVKGEEKRVTITPENLRDYAGVERYHHNEADSDDNIGVTTGLAYTEVGGDLLPIEAVLIPGGKGRITLTGQLGDVMQESAQAAWSYIRSRCYDFGIRAEDFHSCDIHIHVPEGATPKDGPSAGAAMCTTIVSALTQNAVDKDIAMTGEISLRGRVMPIGGLKEKLLAALRGGIKRALIPTGNVKDLEEIPDNVKEGLEIIPVDTVDEVLARALVRDIIPLEQDAIDADIAAIKHMSGAYSDSTTATKH